ncbi:protein FAR1-RELATED SEQUENCE 11-like [Macadamia integrifolia]|uniref:protein FAR1-RELATED SEQUENCE 11-like n=1 Tax=Macadamia integrifolia TaxID=60698 RepID=UPI001C52E759|nr:protein FAR1-RELATED SEQUENCE 11-like [Macadamia integrifolia]
MVDCQIDGYPDLVPKDANMGCVIPTLYVGKTFGSFEQAFYEYSIYARKQGFSVRKQRCEKKKTKDHEVYRRDFVCHRSGNGSKKCEVIENNEESGDGFKKRRRKYWSCHCNCKAHMSVWLSKNGDVMFWEVRSFADDHNHKLLDPNEVCHLRAYRHISGHYRRRILTLEKSRVLVPQILRILETEQQVEVGCLPFNVKDIYNFLSSQKLFMRENDAANLVFKCKHLKSLDLEFQYEYQVDDDNCFEYITWCHSNSVRGYQLYGDVVFDTTYKLNAYDMPVGIWVGVNNHGCSVFLGCCLLRDERQMSFEWAFKVLV